MARGPLSGLGNGNSVTSPDIVIRPIRPLPDWLNQSASIRATRDSGLLPGVMPAPNSTMPPVRRDAPDFVALTRREPDISVRPERNSVGAGVGAGHGEFGDLAGHADAPNAVACFLGEPKIFVAADDNPHRSAGAIRQKKLAPGVRPRIETADFCCAVLAEPQILVGTFDGDVGLAIRCRDFVFADDRLCPPRCAISVLRFLEDTASFFACRSPLVSRLARCALVSAACRYGRRRVHGAHRSRRSRRWAAPRSFPPRRWP